MKPQMRFKIFLGNTPVKQRQFIKDIFNCIIKKEPNIKVIVPCCGQFSLPQMLIDSGVKPENIICSDISIFSNILGYYITDQEISSLGFELLNCNNFYEYNKLETEQDRVAYLFWLMIMTKQTEITYRPDFQEGLMAHSQEIISKIKEQIKFLKTKLKGITYRVKDMKDEIIEGSNSVDEYMIINPPAYKGGYTKMFDFSSMIKYGPKFTEFILSKETKWLYDTIKAKEGVILLYHYDNYSKKHPASSEEYVYTREYKIGKRRDCWICNKPDILRKQCHNLIGKVNIDLKPKPHKNLKVWGSEDIITEMSKIQWKILDDNTALIYRDLFSHRLGTTNAETHLGLFIDDKLHSVVGFHFDKVKRLVTNYAQEDYGFSAYSSLYRNNRLLMLLITSGEMRNILMSTFHKNRFFEIKGFTTTCLSKYRVVKINQGILTKTSREKMKNGIYKIKYQDDFRNDNFKDSLRRFLIEEEQYSGARKYPEN